MSGYRGGGRYYDQQQYYDYPPDQYYDHRGYGYDRPRRGGYRRNYNGGGYGYNNRQYYNNQNRRGRGGYNNYRQYNNQQQRGGYQQKRQYNNNNNNNYANNNEEENDKVVDTNFDYDDADWMQNINKPEVDDRVQTADVTKTKGSHFSDFSLNKKLLRGILEHGFVRPSPVQEESIPNILMGNNVLCRAKNGTGKTGAYCIPLLQLIKVDKTKNYIQALVLVPTRELALQTSRFIKKNIKIYDWIECYLHHGRDAVA